MNKKLKRGALALGTIATIAAPVAAVVSCGATANTINWNDNDTYAGVKAKEFLNQIKHLGKTKQNAITVGREQMMELQYQSESIRSIMAQVEDFRYQNWQTEMENKKLAEDQAAVEKDKADNQGASQETKDGYDTKIQSIKDSIDDNNDKKDEVQKHIDTITALLAKLDTTQEYIADKDDAVKNFYENDYKSSDYPEVYKPLTSIHEEKKAIVEDAYKNFYPEFNTRAEGDAEWPKELASKYGNAATFDQAIDYLVNQEISTKAFNSYKFEINKGFTVEKALWAKYIDTNAWKFLDDSKRSKDIEADVTAIGTTKADIEKNILLINKGEPVNGNDIKASVLSSPQLFLGSTSPDHRMPPEALDELGQVVKYQHLLIKATQGKTPEELWTIKADDLKKLMEFVRYDEDGAGTEKIAQGSTLLQSSKLFDDSDTDFTDFVLGAISGNSAGTLKTQGSLGIKSEIEYLKAMVPGFSLGALSITKGKGTPQTVPTLDLKGLVDNLQTAMQKELAGTYAVDIAKPVGAKDIDTVNNDIDAVITALGDDKVKTIFGKVFEDFFKDKKELVYKLANGPTDTYLVISQFGIHLIKRTSYVKTATPGSHDITVGEALSTDLENMARDASLTSSTTISNELNTYFSDAKVMEALIGDTSTGTDTAYVKALKEKLDEYNKGKDDVDKVKFSDVTDIIESVNTLADKTAVDGAIGDKLENWLVSQLDADLRVLPGGTTTAKLSDMYEWVKDAQEAGGTK